MEQTIEEFAQLAEEKFGEKVMYAPININEKTLDLINNRPNPNYEKRELLTKEDFTNYPKQVWLVGNKCPICGSDLLGIFGVFEWGIIHGTGFCSSCNKINFQFYHYIKGFRFEAFSIIAF
jgi:hypothetical protein